jgi:hypothetical protein
MSLEHIEVEDPVSFSLVLTHTPQISKAGQALALGLAF